LKEAENKERWSVGMIVEGGKEKQTENKRGK
jgi:hypothetical protein